MKTQNILLLLIAGVVLYQYQKQQQSGTIHWIDCNSPGADPVMCALIQEQQRQLLLEAMVP